MARRYRNRRYRPRTARRFRMRRSTLKRIKKDIMKCNFPTKVKFMGLTEKKVMFLTKSFEFTMAPAAGQGQAAQHPDGISFYLDPLIAENINSILKTNTIVLAPPPAEGQQPVTGDFIVSNWDKLCILGIYIKFQPKKNTWTADGNANINTVKCTYTMNNFPSQDVGLVKYDKECLSSKQVFTFNSNEAFTMYVPAPTTMCSDSPCVHKSKTWWALADLAKNLPGNTDFITGDESESEGESEEGEHGEELGDAMDEDVEMGQNNADPYYCTPKVTADVYKPYIHAGRVHLESVAASYNVTINFKVALKG